MIKCNAGWKLKNSLFVKLSQVQHVDENYSKSQVFAMRFLLFFSGFVRCIRAQSSFFRTKIQFFFVLISDTYTLAASQPIDLIWYLYATIHTQQKKSNEQVQRSVYALWCMKYDHIDRIWHAFTMLPFLSIIKRCLFEAEILSINRFMLSNLEPDLFSINSTLKTKQNKIKQKTILVSCVCVRLDIVNTPVKNCMGS